MTVAEYPAASVAHERPVRRWLVGVYLGGACLLVLAIALQVFFAGAAVLVDGRYLIAHRSLGHLIQYGIMVLILLGLGSGLAWRTQGLGCLLWPLVMLQYVFLHVPQRFDLPIMRALHAVNALVFFGLLLLLIRRVWGVLRQRQGASARPSC